MSTAPRYRPHYTVADYRQWEGRWELWDGVAVAMSPSPFGRHAKALARAVASLQSAVDASGCPATVLVEIDWIVSGDTVLRPDLLIVCGPEPERHVERVPALVVEVLSEATRERDLHAKLELYREQGVHWYLIIDPDAARVRALRLADGRYEERIDGESQTPVAIDLCATCTLRFDPARLFG